MAIVLTSGLQIVKCEIASCVVNVASSLMMHGVLWYILKIQMVFVFARLIY